MNDRPLGHRANGPTVDGGHHSRETVGVSEIRLGRPVVPRPNISIPEELIHDLIEEGFAETREEVLGNLEDMGVESEADVLVFAADEYGMEVA